jgi:hypothetical protein
MDDFPARYYFFETQADGPVFCALPDQYHLQSSVRGRLNLRDAHFAPDFLPACNKLAVNFSGVYP